MTTAQARAWLERATAASTDPELSADEITDLLLGARRPDPAYLPPPAYREWQANTAYALGDLVLPRTGNDHYYTVTTAGTTDASEPTWPTDSGDTVTDGSVVFTEAGASLWVYTWDLNAAAAEGWRWKMAKVSNRVNFSAGGQSLSQDQFTAHCERMIAQYQRKIATTVSLHGYLRRVDARNVATNADG